MRIILFRGKTINNGEWVEGDLLHPDSEIGCGYSIEHIDKVKKNNCHEVVFETIGQFTGLTDKNGKNIFEGDIIRFAEWSKGDMCWIGEIFFERTMFQIKGGANKECESNFVMQLSRIPSERIEVIGNIYDNTELLTENDNV